MSQTPEDYLSSKGFKLRGAPGQCLEWTGTVNNMGYGKLTSEGKSWYAHRLAFTLWHGPIPDGVFVLHHCDNPPCCNPEHLWLGTQTDNMRDCADKGRNRFRSSLNESQVRDIRERYVWGMGRDLAFEYGVHPRTISRIVKRHTWK